MLWFLLLIVLLGAGFYFYQELLTIQREIREEQQEALESQAEAAADKAEPAEDDEDDEADESAAEPTVEPSVVEEEPTLEGALLKEISAAPGLLQSDIYSQFPDYTRKQLQQAIRKLEDAGALRREKQGSSYLLFPAE